jgi:hypothetical protein
LVKHFFLIFQNNFSLDYLGTLVLDMFYDGHSSSDHQTMGKNQRREIQTRMVFGDTEIKVSALDVTTGKCVRATIDFLNK